MASQWSCQDQVHKRLKQHEWPNHAFARSLDSTLETITEGNPAWGVRQERTCWKCKIWRRAQALFSLLLSRKGHRRLQGLHLGFLCSLTKASNVWQMGGAVHQWSSRKARTLHPHLLRSSVFFFSLAFQGTTRMAAKKEHSTSEWLRDKSTTK